MKSPGTTFIILFTAFVISCSPTNSDKPDGLYHTYGTSVEEAGFHEINLGFLDSLFMEYIDKQAIASGEVIVVKNGSVAYHKSFSPKGVTSGQDSLFRIMSMTKAITSVAAMQLYERGEFLLDDPVEKYLPEFARMQVIQSFDSSDTTYTSVNAERKITIRDLLRHTSGLAYGFTTQDMQMLYSKGGVVDAIPIGTEVKTMADNVRLLARMPLVHEPGTRYTYGLNTDVLGYLVEVISGKTLDRYFYDHIFTPLNMKDSYFFVPENKSERLASIFSNTQEIPVVKMDDSSGMARYHAMSGETYFSGGAGLSTTAKDYAVFLQMLLNNGVYNGNRILGSHTVDLMVTNQLARINGSSPGGSGDREFAFGLGFEIGTEDSYRVKPGSMQRYSWGGALSTTFWWDSENDLAVVGMIQMIPFLHGDLWERMEVIIYGALNE